MAPLTADLGPLIGRERDLEDLRAALSSARLLTLTGAGGVGKSRLAAAVAADHPGESWWVELADAGSVVAALVQTLGVRPLPGASEADAAIGFLGERRALLVVDNCEHVVDEVARLALGLLGACPSLTLLATSRRALGVRGETRWAVQPLSLPRGDSLADLSGSGAARLFVDRARRVDRRWPVNVDSAGAIAEICRQLEGMPLALELAAARVAVLAPAEIVRGLGAALDLRPPRSHGAAPRQRTLRASLAWSHELLPPDARVLLRRLGVFAGGASLELLREVCGDNVLELARDGCGDDALELARDGCGDDALQRDRVAAALETLVEHSLVQTETDAAAVRYRLLETVRQYALEQLADAGERELLRDRHLDALMTLAERQRRAALTPRQPEVFAALDPEAANLAAALERALERDPAKALRLCLALDFWYRARARFREADEAYARAVGASDPPPVLQARALAAWAWIVGNWGDFTRANELATDAAARAEATGDDGAIAICLLVLANHRFFTDPLAAVELLRRCRELARAADDEFALARSEALLRGVAWFQQDERACRAGYDELRPRLERLGDRETLAWFWFEQGAVCYPLGEHERAAELLGRAVATAREIGEPTADRAARTYLALIDVAAGRASGALAEMLSTRADTLLHGGSFALPWIELLVGVAEAACGRLDAARERLANLVAIDAWGAAHALAWARAELAEVLRLLGEHDDAARHGARALDEAGRHGARALADARALGNDWLAAKAQLTLGALAASRASWADAASLHHAALATIAARGYRLELAAAFEALAAVSAGLGRTSEAARILGAAGRARRELGFAAWPARRAEVAALAARLGGPELEQAWSEGAALEPAAAVAWLRRARGARNRPAHGWESLTPTEVAVVRHAAAGLTNPQIAAQLLIARGTVKTHLSNVYGKLGVRNRSQLAAQATGRLPTEGA